MKDVVESKGIKYVWHFTRLVNSDGIFSLGLINRQRIMDTGLPSEFNDDYRFDGHEDSICCSLGHPNYKMFYRLRQKNPDSEWIVIALQPSILWEKDCAFCVTNAASNEVTCIPIECRKGIDAFNKLFEEVLGKPLRSELDISNGCPTNPQAEVLVFGDIEPNYIIGAITQSKQTEEALKAKYPKFEFLYHRALFSPRKDYQHWK